MMERSRQGSVTYDSDPFFADEDLCELRVLNQVRGHRFSVGRPDANVKTFTGTLRVVTARKIVGHEEAGQ